MSKNGFRGAKDGVPFAKGDPRINRSGRPPLLPDLKETIARVLEEEDKKGISTLEQILRVFAQRALKGDVRAGAELLDRGYGKAKQFTDMNIDMTLDRLDTESLIELCNLIIEKQNEQR